MSDTPDSPNDCMKLLDADWRILLFKNDMGSYSAVALKPGQDLMEAMEHENQITDDFTPTQALYRLTEKVFGRIA